MKRIIFFFILFFLIFAAFILLGEVSIRAYDCLSGKGGNVWLPDEYLGVRHAPNSDFVYYEDWSKEFSFRHKTNSLGLIGEEIRANKPSNVFRILVLGDSFTEALQVEKDKNFCKQLEYLLNKSYSTDNKRFEVINAGMSNYSPIQEYLFLKRELLRLNPDMIILQMFTNDVFEDHKIGAMSIFDKSGLPLKINRSFKDDYAKDKDLISYSSSYQEKIYKIKRIIVDKSALFQSIARALGGRYKHSKFNKQMDALPEYADANQFFIIQDYNPLFKDIKFRDKALSDTKKYISAIKDLSSALKADFFIFLIPPEKQLKLKAYGESSWYFPGAPKRFLNDQLNDFSKKNKILYLDLLPSFEKNKNKNLYLVRDGHLNNAGNFLVAQEIFNFISNKKLLTNAGFKDNSKLRLKNQ